jgi:hypothetical protein
VTNTKCRIDTVVSPDDGHIVARNMYRKEKDTLRKIVHQVGFIYKMKCLLIGTGLHDNGYAYARLLYYLFRTEFPFIMNEAPLCGVFTLFLLKVES